MPRFNLNSVFYRSVRSTDTSADRYITFGSHATYLLNTGGISLWAKRGGWRADGEYVFELYRDASNYVRASWNGNRILVRQYVGGVLKMNGVTFSPQSGALESWHNLTFGWDSSSFDVYFDKSLVISVAGNMVNAFGGNPTLYVATANAAGSGFFFDGYTTRVALYSVKPTQAQVNQIWNTESPSSEVSAWDYTDISGSTITLTRGSGNNGTIIQGSIVGDVPCKPRLQSHNIVGSIKNTTSSGYTKTASSSSYALTSGSFSARCRFDLTQTATSGAARVLCLASATGHAGSDAVIEIYKASATTIALFVYSVTPSRSVTVTSANLLGVPAFDGNFHTLTGHWSSSGAKLYMDGNLIATSASNCEVGFSTTPFLTVGNYGASTFGVLGDITDIQIASGIPTEQEVRNVHVYGANLPGLISRWNVDTLGSTTVTDTQGVSSLTLTSATLSTATPLLLRSAIQNIPFSVRFNGTTQYGSKSSMAFGSATKLVWDGWVYPANPGTTSQVLTSSDISGQAFEIQYNNTAIGANAFVGLVGVAGVYNYWATAKFPPNQWYRLTVVYDSTEGATTRVKVYVNGRLSGANSSANNVSPTFATQTLEMGARTSAAIYWKGSIGPTRIYSGYAWTQSDVLKAYQQNIYPSSGTLLANWGFTDGNGTTVTDSSGNSNNITLVNTPTWVLNSPANNRLSTRSFPYSLQFIRASSSRVAIPYANLGTTLSFSAWIRPRIGANSGDIVGIMDTLIRISPTDIKFYTDGTLGGLASASITWEHNKLYHIGVSVTGTTVKFYVNGTLLATATASSGVDTTNSSNFIGYYGVAAQTFEGEIAQVAIWSRVLTDAEFAAIYFQNQISLANLERWYKCDDGSGTNVNDSSANNQDGTITAAVWQSGFFANRTSIS